MELTLYPGVTKYPFYLEMDGFALIVHGPKEYPQQLNREGQWVTVDDARFRMDADRISKEEFDELVAAEIRMITKNNSSGPSTT